MSFCVHCLYTSETSQSVQVQLDLSELYQVAPLCKTVLRFGVQHTRICQSIVLVKLFQQQPLHSFTHGFQTKQ